MPERLRAARRKAVGARQTIRALHEWAVPVVYVANDADQWLVRPVIELAHNLGAEVVEVDTMTRLGRFCGIEVGAACAAIVNVDASVH